MTEREFKKAYTLLKLYETHYAMIKKVKTKASSPSYLASVPSSVAHMSNDVAAGILLQLGFVQEATKMLQGPKVGKEIANLYEPKEADEIQIPSLFHGVPISEPLFRPKELPPPTRAQIEEAINDLADRIDHIAKKIDRTLCDAKSQPYFAKFAVAVRAIESYYL